MSTLHGRVLVTLVSQTTCCLRLVFAAPKGDLKKQFLLYTYQTTALLPGIFLFWFGAVYKLCLVSYGLKTVSKDACMLGC